jgi:hypothetical protein
MKGSTLDQMKIIFICTHTYPVSQEEVQSINEGLKYFLTLSEKFVINLLLGYIIPI